MLKNSISNKAKKVKEKRWQNIQISLVGLVFILIGIMFLGINHVHDYSVLNQKLTATPDETVSSVGLYDGLLYPIFNNLGITLIALGCGSLLLELYGYASYFKKRVSEVFTEKEMISLLSNEYKRELKSSVIQSLYAPNTDDSNELLSLFDKQLAELLSTLYYSDFDLKVELSLLNDKYIKKTFVRTITIEEINSLNQNWYKNIFEITCKKLEDDYIPPYKLTGIIVDSVPVCDFKQPEGQLIQGGKNLSDRYRYRCELPQEIEIKEKINLIVKYETVVPVDDILFSCKMDRLCKNFKCTFIFNKDEFELRLYGFNFSPEKRSFKLSGVDQDSWRELHSQGWMLPGEGIVCATIKK